MKEHMDNYHFGQPEGTRDLIFDQNACRRELLDNFRKVYERSGYREIVTPTLEYYDLFSAGNMPIPAENMYKLIDSSRVLVLRPDNTTPIARIASAKLRSSPLPLYIFYSQQVFRINDDYSGRRSEFMQSGVEIIGSDSPKSTVACIATALELLATLGIQYKLEIGSIAFYKAVIKSLGLSPADEEIVRASVAKKNPGSLGLLSTRVSQHALQVIQTLPRLFGGEEVFERAAQIAGDAPGAREALDELQALYDCFCSAGYRDSIIIDLGIVHQIDYYSGCVFRGYVEGAGEQVLSGGRYDGLLSNYGYDCPACGFAVNVDLIADALKALKGQPPEAPVDALIYYDTPADFGKALIASARLAKQGKSCCYSCADTPEQAAEYAKSRGIPEVLHV